MSWSASAIFRSTVVTWLSTPAEALDLDTDAFKVALYNNSITPNKDDTQANNCFNAGQWTTTNELSDAAEWATGGVALASPAISTGAGFVMWDATDTVSTGTSATLAAVFGCMVYDDTSTTPSDQGICYNYFGGTNSVTDGTFTVVWHANGLLRITV